ncbi:hypothetical protein AAC387_Pa02g3602 [Persea americana]
MSLQAKGPQEDHFDKDFEPRPNISVYEGDGVQPEEESKDSFAIDFEPRPNISIHQPEEKGRSISSRTLIHSQEPPIMDINNN